MKQMDVALDPTAGTMKRGVLAIDPGPEKSGWCIMFGDELMGSGISNNNALLSVLRDDRFMAAHVMAIEMIASYGMAVGKEVFETCVWIGRFMQRWHTPESVRLIYRKDVKLHLCGTTKAKDANVRQAIIDLYPATGGGKTPQIGTKAQPGPLYGVSSHAWPAIGVALTVQKGEF